MTDFSPDLLNQPVILDNGSSVIKAGFAGSQQPDVLEYAWIGNPLAERSMVTVSNKKTYIGNSAYERRATLHLESPYSTNAIMSWDRLEDLWDYVLLNKLEIEQLQEHPVVLTNSMSTSKKEEEKMCEVLFEKFSIPAIYCSRDPIMSLYGLGRTTGCSVSCGHRGIGITTVIDGMIVGGSSQISNTGGSAVTNTMLDLLRHNHPELENGQNGIELMRSIKERCCELSKDFYNEIREYELITSKASNNKYRLPDGNIIEIGSERFEAPEIIFNPQAYGYSEIPLQKMIINSISRAGILPRSQLLESIVLSGGSSLIKGFGERLTKEIRKEIDGNQKIMLNAPHERRLLPWIGGSVLSGLSTMKLLWKSKSAYREDKHFDFNTLYNNRM
ncbi:Actin [Nakaseomyces glabratus]